MANNFCRYLANQKRFIYGQLQPCCWFTQSADLSDSEEVNKYLEKLYNITDWTPECSFCHEREKNNMHSPRLESFQRIPLREVGNNFMIEVEIDRDCNGACLICDITKSTTWWKHNPDVKVIDIDYYLDNELDVKKYLKQLKEQVNFEQVEKVSFNGGEPLRSDTHLEIINEIEKAKPLDSVTLIYNTNGSIMPDDKLIELWKKFKRINLSLSIDGINEHFDYLRWPLKWSQVESNLKALIDLKIPTFNFRCSYTVTPLNIFYHDRYVSWARDFFADTVINAETFFSTPTGPSGIMDLSAVPTSLQNEITAKYQSPVLNGHSVAKLLTQFNPTSYQKFMEYITKHDQYRGLDWRKVFPEVVQYFEP